MNRRTFAQMGSRGSMKLEVRQSPAKSALVDTALPPLPDAGQKHLCVSLPLERYGSAILRVATPALIFPVTKGISK